MPGEAFVSTESVAVFLKHDPQNIIFIKPKMDLGTQTAVQSAFLRITANAGGGQNEAEIDPAAYNLALLLNNITDWAGPMFRGLKCNVATIPRLDPDLDILDAVLAEINKRNAPKVRTEDGESPNLPAPVGGNTCEGDGTLN